MAYRPDTNLDFLFKLKDEELKDLVRLLTHDKDGEIRRTEELTGNALYKRYYPKHSNYVKEIIEEIQRFGGNTIANAIFRFGKGVSYREVLTDVCDHLKVKYQSDANVELIEDELLLKIATDSFEKMSEQQKAEFAKEIGVKNIGVLNKQSFALALQTIFRSGGFQSYQLTLIIVNAVLKAILGRGLSLAGNALLMRTASILAGPIGWFITGAWGIVDIAGPAYRVTIPAVVQIAFLRKLYEANKNHYAEMTAEFKFKDN